MNNMKQNDWTSQMRRRLAGREAPVPGDLWNRIERQLDRDCPMPPAADCIVNTAPRARRVGIRRMAVWAVSAAAAVALVVAVAYRANESTVERLASRRSAAVATSGSGVAARQIAAAECELLAVSSGRARGAGACVGAEPALACNAAAAASAAASVAAAETAGEAAAVPEEASPASASASGSDAATSAAPHADSAPQPRRTPRSGIRQPWHPSEQASAPGRRFTLSAHTGGSLADSRSTTFRGRSVLCSSSLFAVDGAARGDGEPMSASSMLLSGYNEVRHHAQPLTLGVSLGYALNSRLMLTTGVVYTRAVTDFIKSSGTDEIVETQKLHYVGVPLALKCGLWSSRLLQLYATVGGEADFNVAASVESGGVSADADRDRVQLSAAAAAGIQLNCLPGVGVFAEPGVKYYFDNRSSVETIFKDKPWAFSMQMGLRVEF